MIIIILFVQLVVTSRKAHKPDRSMRAEVDLDFALVFDNMAIPSARSRAQPKDYFEHKISTKLASHAILT